jgi:hypothetical protein
VTARVAIDLNVRVRGNQTYAGFEDADRSLATGDEVEVFEPETGLAGPGRVTDVDNKRRLVYLAVDWPALREPERATGTLTPSSHWFRVSKVRLGRALGMLRGKQVSYVRDPLLPRSGTPRTPADAGGRKVRS